MRSINKVILIGNLTRDPETKEVQNGQRITTFSVATNRRWITSSGEEKISTEYHDCVAWAKLAEICEQYLKKGKLVYIEGYLKTRSWTTEEGVKKFRTEIVVQDLIMLDKRQKEGEGDYVPTEEVPDTSVAGDQTVTETVTTEKVEEPEKVEESEGVKEPEEKKDDDENIF